MRTFSASFLMTALLLVMATFSFAETRYVSDHLVVTVRSNKTDNYQVLATLGTASAVDILNEDANYLKVRTSKGVEGYIRKQYITKALPKSLQIATLEKQKAALENELAQQQQNLKATSGLANTHQAENDQLTGDLKQTKQQLEKLSSDYTALLESSGNVINLGIERDQLLEENLKISNQLIVLQEENKDFHRTNMIQWFLAGGGVLLVGWLLGKVSRKQRNYSRF